MPHFTGTPQHDQEIQEVIDRNLFRISQMVKAMGFNDLTDEELVRMRTFATQQAQEAIARSRQQRQPPQALLPSQIQPGDFLNPRRFVEGGLINDSSGQATARIRSQLGIPPPPGGP